MSRILGVDYGSKRIGLAISDPGGIIATPVRTETCSGEEDALKKIIAVCTELKADKIVLGLPLNMNGSQGPQAEKVTAFGEKLKSRLDIPLEMWDERLSSVSAERVLIDAGTSRRRRKEVIDKLAAQIMLQNYLDAHTELPPYIDEEDEG